MRCRQLPVLFLVLLCFCFSSCNKKGSGKKIFTDSVTTDTLGSEDSSKHYFVMDTMDREAAWNEYFRVVNLLEFHTRDTMKTDSTYVATLSMGKNISSAELNLKVKDILEPGGVVKVRDTTQEISMHMKATLEDKASRTDPNFEIELLGGESNMRTYDAKKNKMVWQWNVTPKKEGNHELILSISHVNEEGSELGSPETRKHSITIFSSKKKGNFFSGLADFFGKYWQWLLGAIAIPVFIAWFTTRRKNMPVPTPTEAGPNQSNAWKRKRRRNR